jgi:dihydrofolate reductase
MAKLVLTMTMSLDGFFSGPNGELDWMTQAPDPEFSRDNVAFFDHIHRLPDSVGNAALLDERGQRPAAPADQRTLAEALNKLRPFLISDREEAVPWPNAELLVVHDDEQLADAVRKEKARPGKDLGVPGGIRTAQTFVRLGLVDEYVLTVHPIALGNGKRVFSGKTGLELIDAKTYRSGVIRARYRPSLRNVTAVQAGLGRGCRLLAG